MRKLSESELQELGSQFGVEVDDGEVEAVRDRVNSMLDGLDDVYDVPFPDADQEPAVRAWRRPIEDPHNAISALCDVPPYDEHSGLLDGVTVGLKDIIAVAGVPMECASALMYGFMPSTDATVVDRLRRAGATIAAKTNLDEMAASAWGDSFKGDVTNPHDAERIAGGSSGGSAVAVATETVDVALGTDTGGSIRIPSAFCGVVGLKPTWGLVPLRGVVENTYTQDYVGPMARSVEDVALVLEAIAGVDEQDPGSGWAASRENYRVGGYAEAVRQPPDPSSVTVGRLTDGFGDGIAEPVEGCTEAALDRLADAGASVVDVSVDGYDQVNAVKNALSLTELAGHWSQGGAPVRRGGTVDEAYQAALSSRRESRGGELGPHYKSKLLAGARLLNAHGGRHYTRAQAVRETLAKTVESTFETVDVLAMPTMPDVAPTVAESRDPGFKYGRNTRLGNVTRHPALTLPSGTENGLPVGLQLMGPAFGECDLLGVGQTVEETLDWARAQGQN